MAAVMRGKKTPGLQLCTLAAAHGMEEICSKNLDGKNPVTFHTEKQRR